MSHVHVRQGPSVPAIPINSSSNSNSNSSSNSSNRSSSNAIQKVLFLVPLSILIVERFMGAANLVNSSDAYTYTYEELSTIRGTSLDSLWNSTMDKLQQQQQQHQQRQQLLPKPTHNQQPESDPPQRNTRNKDNKDNKRIQVPLEYLTGPAYTCPDKELVFVDNVISPTPLDTSTTSTNYYHIPKYVHQTSKSKCLTPTMAQITEGWRTLGQDWSYYFHDDASMARLFALDWTDSFPHLQQVHKCIATRGTQQADLWRYLILYEYGGVYADIDSKPEKFNATTIAPEDQGFFVVEQYHLLSQYFMAMAPKHPLMYYAIHAALLNILNTNDLGMMDAATVTGPHALHLGYIQYRKDVHVRVPLFGPGEKCVWKDVFAGTANTTIRVEGRGENENEYVRREAIARVQKKKEYAKLDMVHFQQDRKRTRETCVEVMHRAKEDSRRRLLEYRGNGGAEESFRR
jgi:mannosyltransferase OCH1-like enzyme